MKSLLLVYTTWPSVSEAKKAGRYLLQKRLCGCVNIFPKVNPMFWWPPKSGKIDETNEVVMIIKTLSEKYKPLEKEVEKIHPFDTPCIIAIPTFGVSKKYYKWIASEIK